MRKCSDPIFVLDSGLGGLTVVRSLLERLPNEHIVYFGDTARLPYGSKTRQTVTGFVQQIIGWGKRLRPKHVVIACNTASALALPKLRQTFAPLTISGVVDPGAKAAAAAAGANPDPYIGVIATEATVRSEAYPIAIQRRRRRLRLSVRATPLLVPMIEEGRTCDDPLVELALKQYLAPMVRGGLDVLVLGCTHYPLLKPAIQRIVGDSVPVIDSAEACAEDVATKLELAKLANDSGPLPERDRLQTFVTDDAGRFETLATRFLGFGIGSPTLVPPESLYESKAEAVRASA